jgi:ElaB/YqjD/DUF883 family membrane-anchored ribosome-binding protein
MPKIKPWIAGLIDNLAGSNLIRSTHVQHRNRLALIMLDSGLEIAFKNFLEFEKKLNIPGSATRERERLQKIVKKHTSFDEEVWSRIGFFYKLRCDLYHEESEKTLTDPLVEEFHELVEFVLDQLFGIESRKLVPTIKEMLTEESAEARIPVNRIKEKINVIVTAVRESLPKDAQEIQEALKKMGYRGTLSVGMINDNLRHWYPHLFYYDKRAQTWKLSDEGERRYEAIRKSVSS